jgi:aminopeptidase N
MEYPMISFNGYRPVKDEKTGVKTYTRNAKNGLVGVVIHEVGHNYFPMTVNSDERQWTWMDEGLNSFLEFMAELRWDEKFPVLGGNANSLDEIGAYMMSEDQVPIMTNSESVIQFGNNAYNKPAAALTVLRETVMGRELFDYAFKEYSRRWKFKRPTPADFFRTMEDASGVDLDWFWRGWFYTTDHVDIALNDVREYRLSTKNPEVEGPLKREYRQETKPEPVTVTENRAAGEKTYVERHPDAKDFYDQNDDFAVNNKDLNDYATWQDAQKEPEKSAFAKALSQNPYIYFMDFENIGGLVSPLPLKFTFDDGSAKEIMIPAEIWRVNNEKVTKLFVETKKIVSVELDAKHQTADAVRVNNAFPRQNVPSRMDLFRSNQSAARNQMADALVELKAKQQPAGAAAPIAPTNPR